MPHLVRHRCGMMASDHCIDSSEPGVAGSALVAFRESFLRLLEVTALTLPLWLCAH